MNRIILIGCFTPLALIWIIMKISVWIAAVNDEQNYVREESRKNHTDLIWSTHMQMLTKRKRSMEIAQIIDESCMNITLRRVNLLNWKKKDPEWWTEYLIRLGLDPRNP